MSAWRGQAEETAAHADRVDRAATERGQVTIALYAHHALNVLHLGIGQPELALDHARRVLSAESPFLSNVALPDVVEAAQASGDLELATSALQRQVEQAEANETPLSLGLLARSRAIAGSTDQVVILFEESIALLDQAGAVGQSARSHLLLGEWLRAANRPQAAREPLKAAHRQFTEIGAGAFAERARLALLAVGERVEEVRDREPTPLTFQEQQIARLAAGGSTNPEIAAQVFLSPSTVDYHLRKVFQKLGITSRRQLGDALGD